MSIAITAVCFATVARADAPPSWRRAPENTFQLGELVLARKVVDRKPLETGQTIAADGQRVYAFLNAFNKGGPRPLKIVWQRGEKTYHRASVVVGRGPSWRTWAFIDARPSLKGSWAVRVLDESGAELSKIDFTIE
jgi:hypothetical protein